jgi:hypothetical protein
MLLGLLTLVSMSTAFAQTPNAIPQRALFPPGMPDPLQEKDLVPAAKLASDFGLKDHLSTDCSTESGKPGHVRVNEQEDGSVVVESIDPDGSRVRTVMYKGKQLDAHRVEFLGYATYNGPPLKRLVWQKDGEKFRFVSSQTLEGIYLIRDSKLGNRVWQWISRCPG